MMKRFAARVSTPKHSILIDFREDFERFAMMEQD